MKTKVRILNLSQFATICIANNQVKLFLISCFEKKTGKVRGLKPTNLTSLKLKSQSCGTFQKSVHVKVPETDSVKEIYEPFLSGGFVSLNGNFTQSTPI